MPENGCFIHRIEFRTGGGPASSIVVDMPFNDIHRLHSILERVGYERKCEHGTLLIAYDIRGNILSAMAFDEHSTGIQPPISFSISTHSKVWEDALGDLTGTFHSGKFPSFDDSLCKKIIKSARIAFDNGAQLLEDAELLFDHARIARSGSLAILAFEEFAKSFLLKTCVIQKRWDREIYLGLRDHAKKQAVLYGALTIAPTISQHHRVSFGGGNFIPTSQIENVTKTFADRKHLDRLKQYLQFSDVKKDGSCDGVSIDRQDVLIGIYLAKLAWYYLSYVHDGKNVDKVKKIEEGHTITLPPDTRNIAFEKIHFATHSICFQDSTICTVNHPAPINACSDESFEVLNSYLKPIVSRARNILEGRGSIEFSPEAVTFWRQNQNELDVCGQLEAEQRRLGYRYSPYLAAIKDIVN